VALVRVEDIILNEELIKEGFAWVYPQYCHRPYLREVVRPFRECTRRQEGALE
jgi:endonuclease YncB( thermonuclease family)